MRRLDRGSYPIQSVAVRQLSRCRLLKCGHSVVQPDFFRDHAVLDAEHGCSLMGIRRLAPLIGWNSVNSWYSTTTKTLPSSDLAWNLRISCSKGAALLDAAERFGQMIGSASRRL